MSGLRSILACVVFAGLATACSSTAADNNYTISLSLGNSSAAIAQGSSAQIAATVTRGGGYTSDIALTVQGAPAGVTASTSSLQTSGSTTTGTITLTVGASAAPGSYTLTVRAAGSGVSDATATIALTVTAAGTSSITVTAAGLTVAAGASGTSAITISRSNFTGDVSLSASGVPSGITVTFDPGTVTGTTSTATVTVGASVNPATYPVTINGSGTGVANASATLSVVVTAATGFTLSPSPASLSAAQGTNGISTITVNRTGGFSSAVALSASGLPTGVTASFNPTSATGNSSVLTLTASASAAVGMSTVTVTGTSGALTAHTTITLTVTSSGGGGNTLTLDYSLCDASEQPIWVAYKDGTGAWTVASGTNHIYHITISSNSGGYAAVTGSAGIYNTNVYLGTKNDLTLVPIAFCTTPTVTGGYTVGFTVAGLQSQSSLAFLGLGGSLATAFGFNPAGQFLHVPAGTFDLIGYAQQSATAPSSTDRGYVQRGVAVSADMNLGSIDFGGSHSFAPMPGTITITNPVGGETFTANLGYLTSAACYRSELWSAVNAPSTFTGYGIPTSQQTSGEYHSLIINGDTPTSSRSDFEDFQAFGNRNVTLPALLAGVNIMRSGTAYTIEAATFTAPTDITSPYMSFYYADGTNFNSAQISASPTYLASAGYSLAMPDFSSLTGFSNSWEPMVGNSMAWSLTAGSAPLLGNQCTEGFGFKSTESSGSN
ncbi:MAG: hypothetical protein ACREL5_07165 [Gemmatimonadales bacterium]